MTDTIELTEFGPTATYERDNGGPLWHIDAGITYLTVRELARAYLTGGHIIAADAAAHHVIGLASGELRRIYGPQLMWDAHGDEYAAGSVVVTLLDTDDVSDPSREHPRRVWEDVVRSVARAVVTLRERLTEPHILNTVHDLEELELIEHNIRAFAMSPLEVSS